MSGLGPQSDQEIQQQANTTANVGRSPNCVRELRNIVAARKPGTFVDGPIEPKYMMVDRQELAFVSTAGRDARSKQGGHIEYRVDTFSSFNGQPYIPGMTQKEFEANFKCVGIATSTQEFSGDIPNHHGFSVVTGGSISIKNVSNTTFFPGDVVMWNAPNLDPRKRVEQYKSSAFGVAASQISLAVKNVATISRLSINDITSEWSDVARTLVDHQANIHIYVVRQAMLRGAPPPSITDEQAAATWLKQFVSLVMYQSLVAAHQLGIVKPNEALLKDPQDAEVQIYLGNRSEPTRTVDAWKTRSVTGAPQPLDHAENVNAFAKNMARITGLSGPGTTNLTEDEGFMKRVLGRVLYSNLGEIEDRDGYASYISDEFTDGLANLPNIFGQASASNPNIPLQMLHVKGDALRCLYRNIVTNALSFSDKAIGTITNTSQPGTQMHMVLA